MLVDVVIILLLVSSLFRGREIGLIRQALSTIGFFGGLFVGAAIEPHFVDHAHTQVSRALLTLAITLGCATITLGVGEYVGMILKLRLQKYKLNRADVWLGSVAGGLTLLITVWLVAPVLAALPFPGLQNAIKGSGLASYLSTSLPKAPNIIADLSHIINPNGFPDVFTGLEPTPPSDVKLPNLGSMQAVVKKDRASVVKIEGQGCGGIVEGSGFVAGQGFVVTNAHVVAGIAIPYVVDHDNMHSATVVWFDPNLDFAVLRVSHLAGAPLTIDTGRISTNTPGAVLGYPGGGNFTASAASVIDEFTATGRNIYNEGTTNRNVYEVKASIIPGNSGGPLIEQNGDVMGLIFAESTTYNQVGYALAMTQVVTELHQAEATNTPASTGTCAE